MIPYSRQSISKKDISAVLKVLKSDWLTTGPAIPAFEKALADYCGARYAVAVSNGTAALHLACLALGVEKGREVITSPNSFAATANSVLYCGGTPVFADIEAPHWNISVPEIQKKITSKMCGIIPVHFGGQPCDMEAIQKIARRKKLFVLEDACHALGAEYSVKGKRFKVGSCSHSDAVVFSFHPVKSITTGEGGAILTNRKDVYERLLHLRSHGIVKDAAKLKAEPWYYEMQELGFNDRITDLQCALGSSQLEQLPGFIQKRRAIAEKYLKALAGIKEIELPSPRALKDSAWHLFVIQLRLEKLKAGRAEIFRKLREAGLGVQVHYIPIHYQPYYKKLGFKRGSLPVCENYYERAVSIPLFPSMSAGMVRRVIQTLRGVMAENRRR